MGNYHTPKNQFTQTKARDLFNYNPDTGELWWRIRKKGRPHKAIGGVNKMGYFAFAIKYQRKRLIYQVHIISWNWLYGIIPDGLMIDHKDRDKLNNRLGNLRLSTSALNALNRDFVTNSNSGHIGVYWDKSRKKYRVGIRIYSINYTIGRYSDINDAVTARKKAEAERLEIYMLEFWEIKERYGLNED